ncbi:hypothetical protein GQ53DRAFT_523461 [Thozetella sp. PMI_491]|nr:hypothetical protein GQ53DRAFT_523461 [Thozetella sp. PMI_491]
MGGLFFLRDRELLPKRTRRAVCDVMRYLCSPLLLLGWAGAFGRAACSRPCTNRPSVWLLSAPGEAQRVLARVMGSRRGERCMRDTPSSQPLMPSRHPIPPCHHAVVLSYGQRAADRRSSLVESARAEKP